MILEIFGGNHEKNRQKGQFSENHYERHLFAKAINISRALKEDDLYFWDEEEAGRMEEKTDSLFKDPDDLEKLLDQVADLHDTSVDEVSSSIEELLKTIPEDILQEEFGGEVPSIEDFIKYVIRQVQESPEVIGIFLDNLDPEDESSARRALDICNAFYQVNVDSITDDDLHNLYDAAREYNVSWPQPLGRAVLEAIEGYPMWEKDDKTGLM